MGVLQAPGSLLRLSPLSISPSLLPVAGYADGDGAGVPVDSDATCTGSTSCQCCVRVAVLVHFLVILVISVVSRSHWQSL